MSRIDAILLAGIGVLLVHQGAYTLTALSGNETSIAHGHLQTVWLIASLGVLAALTRSVLRSLRHRARGQVSELTLFASIAGGYLLLEQMERAWDGHGAFALFSEPVFWVGLALAPLIALALGWSLRSVEKVIERFVGAIVPTRQTHAACTLHIAPRFGDVAPFDRRLAHSVPRRGPPVISFS